MTDPLFLHNRIMFHLGVKHNEHPSYWTVPHVFLLHLPLPYLPGITAPTRTLRGVNSRQGRAMFIYVLHKAD